MGASPARKELAVFWGAEENEKKYLGGSDGGARSSRGVKYFSICFLK